MSYNYSFHPSVKMDYDDAYEWYEDKSVGLGERFIKAVRKKIEEITENPEVYSSKGKRFFREANVDDFPFLIVYKVDKKEKEIYITSIHHTKKHPRNKYRK